MNNEINQASESILKVEDDRKKMTIAKVQDAVGEVLACDKGSDKCLYERNKVFGIKTYGPELYDLITSGNENKFNKKISDYYSEQYGHIEKRAKDLSILKDLNTELIVLRPEALHLEREFETMLKNSGYQVLLKDSKKLDILDYANVYPENLIDKDSITDFVTRSQVYLSKPVLAYIISRDNTHTHLTKGAPGNFDKNSLRGLLTNKLIGMDSLKLKDLIKSLDRNHMYANIVAGNVEHDDFHCGKDIPWASYALQGFHMPEEHEKLKHATIFLGNKLLSVSNRNIKTNDNIIL